MGVASKMFRTLRLLYIYKPPPPPPPNWKFLDPPWVACGLRTVFYSAIYLYTIKLTMMEVDPRFIAATYSLLMNTKPALDCLHSNQNIPRYLMNRSTLWIQAPILGWVILKIGASTYYPNFTVVIQFNRTCMASERVLAPDIRMLTTPGLFLLSACLLLSSCFVIRHIIIFSCSPASNDLISSICL